MLRFIPLFLFPVIFYGQQLTFSTYLGGGGTESTAGIAQDSTGNLFLAGTTTSTDFPSTSAAGGGFVIKLDSAGNRLAAILIPGIAINAVAVDASNNVVVAGTGTPVPTAGAYSTPKATGFISKLSGKLDQTMWTSTFAANPAALALDASGNVYTAGSAVAGFLTTAGVVQPTNKGSHDAFVLNLSADGSKALYATFLGGSDEDAAYAIAVDSGGSAYITGTTASSNFPVTTPTAFGGMLSNFTLGESYGDAFVAKLDAKGATLTYSTYLGGTAADQGNAIVVDSSGNAFVAGGTESASFLAGAAQGYQTKYAGPVPDPEFPFPSGDAFVAKFLPNGTLAWYTYLGGATYDVAQTIALDRTGNIYLAGTTDSSNFPQSGTQVHDCHIGGRPFLAELDAKGAQLLMTTGLTGMSFDQVYGLVIDAAHSVAYLAGDAQSQVFFASPGAAQTTFGGGDYDSFAARIDLTLQPTLAMACVLNSASFQAGNTAPFPTGAVAPGEIVSLFGLGLGPATPANLQLTADGSVSTSLGGTQVLFDGIAAPMLYASNGQINAVVPYGVKQPVTRMTVQRGSQSAGPFAMPVVGGVPAIFTYDGSGMGQAAALNPDYTFNTVANPVARGSYITFYACGAGLMSSDVDGAVTSTTVPANQLPTPQSNVTVTIRGENAQVLFAGAAPGYVAGLLQVNVVVPTTIDFGDHLPLSMTIGKYSTQLNISIAAK